MAERVNALDAQTHEVMSDYVQLTRNVKFRIKNAIKLRKILSQSFRL